MTAEPTPAEGAPTGLVKVTVNLTAEAAAAILAAAEREGCTRTDAINRAALAWGQITAKPGAVWRYQEPQR